MKYKKGTKLSLNHSRRGDLLVIVLKDFDSEEEWWPLALAEGSETSKGISHYGQGDVRPGESVPARRSFLTNVEVIE